MTQMKWSMLSILVSVFLLMGMVPKSPTTLELSLPEVQQSPSSFPIVRAPLDNPLSQPISYTPEDLRCLQKNIYWEARNQSDSGKVAVATVTINRVRSARFPNTVCGVVKQAHRSPTGSPIRNRCAFSWHCNGLSDTPRLNNRLERYAWDRAGAIASMALSGRITSVEVGDATHYHANYVTPWWSRHVRMTRIGEVDDHIFYQEI